MSRYFVNFVVTKLLNIIFHNLEPFFIVNIHSLTIVHNILYSQLLQVLFIYLHNKLNRFLWFY